MQPEWMEGRLTFNFASVINPVRKPDKDENTLKTVDFIAEYPAVLWLIDVKDPERTSITHQQDAIQETLTSISNDSLLKEHLLPKLYGTFVYLVEKELESRGNILYVTLIGVTELDAALRSSLRDKIQRYINRIGPKFQNSHHSPIADVHNIASWNQAYPGMEITIRS